MSCLRIGVCTFLMIGLLSGGASSPRARVPALIRVIDEKRDELSQFFKKYIGLSDDQIRAIRNGQ